MWVQPAPLTESADFSPWDLCCVVFSLIPSPPSSREGTRLCCVVLLYLSGVPMAFNVITDIPLKKRTIHSSRLSSHTSLGICEVLNCRYTVHKLYSLPFCMHATFSFTSAAQLSGVSYMYIYIQVNGKISNFKVEYRAGTKRKLTRSRLLVHTIYATHNNSHPK